MSTSCGFPVIHIVVVCFLPWAIAVSYYWEPDDRTWNESRDHCETMGRQLVSLHTKEEYESVVSLLRREGSDLDAWISLRLPEDKSDEAYYRWSDGTSLEWSKWDWNDPDALDYKKCVLLRMDYEVYDTRECDLTYGCVCQDVVTRGEFHQRSAYFDKITNPGISSRLPWYVQSEPSLTKCALVCLSADNCSDVTYGSGICSLYTSIQQPYQLCNEEGCATYRRLVK